MDLVSILLLNHRLPVLKRNLLVTFTKILRPTAGSAAKDAAKHCDGPEQNEIDTQERTIVLDDQEDDNDCSTAEHQASGEDLPMNQHPSQEQEPVQLTFEQAQAYRNATYIRFDSSDDVDDYTFGPARFVPGFDGVKQCAALLVPMDFSQKIQHAIRMQRAYVKEERYGEAQERKIHDCDLQIRKELSEYKTRAAEYVAEDGEPDEVTERNLESLDAAIKVLERASDNLQQKKLRLECELEWKARLVREAFADVSVCLEEAFVEACLMEPADETEQPLEEYDMQEQYKEARRELQQEAGENDSCASFDYSPPQLDSPVQEDFEGPEPVDEEQSRKNDLLRAVWEAADRVKQNQAWFDSKEQEQVLHEAQCHREEVEGRPARYESREHFDLHWVTMNRDFTRCLIEAEAAYSEAKAAAIKEGIQFQADNTSSYYGPLYPVSQEIDVQAAADWVAPRVDGWLEKVPDGAEPDEERDDADADEWDFNEPDFSDSISCVEFCSKQRKKIDNWWRDCLLAQKETSERLLLIESAHADGDHKEDSREQDIQEEEGSAVIGQ